MTLYHRLIENATSKNVSTFSTTILYTMVILKASLFHTFPFILVFL